jgi:adenosylcobinamide-GDP ribazoletransferase
VPSPIRPAAAALAFLTRLPVVPRDVTLAELGRSIAWFPLAGLLLGVISAALAWTATPLDPYLRAVAIVALGAYLTGGLHLDGVADIADGLGGGRGDRARSLAIMKDSRIGAFGAIALVLLLLAKVHATALVVAATAHDGAASPASLASLWPLVAAPVIARALAATLIVAFPYARPDGLGRAFHDHARWHHAAFALALAAALVLAAVAASSDTFASVTFASVDVTATQTRAVVASALAATAALTLAAWLHRRLGGLTGDAYGAAIETAELAFLVVATAAI